MFEKYTELARRVVFFARYEASKVGSAYIRSHHLLLGIVREGRKETRFGQSSKLAANADAIISAVAAIEIQHIPISTSVDLPLDNESKSILAYAAEEAANLGHDFIDLEHLLLGMLREACPSAEILKSLGFDAEGVRRTIRLQPPQPPPASKIPLAVQLMVMFWRGFYAGLLVGAAAVLLITRSC